MHVSKPDISNREDIRNLITLFYWKAADDALLGPIFKTLVNTTDKESFYVFWEDVFLNDQPAKQRGLLPHIHLMVSPRHFVRWLNLLLATIDSLHCGPKTDKAKLTVIRQAEEFQASLRMICF
jgi:hemoglobin